MAIFLPGAAEDQALALDEMTPREFVAELDKYVNSTLRTNLRASIRGNKEDGLINRGRPKWSTHVTSVSVAAAPYIATVEACLDEHGIDDGEAGRR